MADNPRESNRFQALGRHKFDLNVRSQREICHGEQAHPDVRDIDAKAIQMSRIGKYLHGGVQQLAFMTSPVWFGLEDHREGQRSAINGEGKDYGRSVWERSS